MSGTRDAQSLVQEPVRSAGAIGALIALAAGIAFALAAATSPSVARYGGAAWVVILTWIILMPVLSPWLKKHRRA